MTANLDPREVGAHWSTDLKPGQLQRVDFSKIRQIQAVPNLIDIQLRSYKWFVEEGMKDVLKDSSNIIDHTGTIVLDYIDYAIDKEPKYSEAECKERDATYAAPLRITCRLTNKETGEIQEQVVFFGDFPLMTETGTFIINGAERVVVSQLVRSPGAYFTREVDKTGNKLFAGTVMPNRGPWIEYEKDANDVLFVRVDKGKKFPVTTLIRAFGIDTDEKIKETFGEDECVLATLEKEYATKKDFGVSETPRNQALKELYMKLRPGEPATVDGAIAHIDNLFFNERTYDLTRVGRYKYNKKLSLGGRIVSRPASRPVCDPVSGEILIDAGEIITREKAKEIENAGVFDVYIVVDEKEIRVFSNGMVDMLEFCKRNGFEFTREELENNGVTEWVKLDVLREILDSCSKKEEILAAAKTRISELIPMTICNEDLFASINYILGLNHGVGTVDDIDHLGNRRIRSVGELLQNQFRIGFSRMERTIKERMNMQNIETLTPTNLLNTRPVSAAIREFFGSSPLSQFMDQTNPLAAITHKRRLSALGPGGLTRDRASFEVRDVHYTHYGRMCPIETPEGPNIGLISYLSSYARMNVYGFIEAPYRRVEKRKNENGEIECFVTDEVEYMTADVEDSYVVAQANEPLDEKGCLKNERVAVRYRDEIMETERTNVDYIDVSPRMVVSVATSLIPFLENDDAIRALMGSNMQRQAVPLIKTEAPIVGTGMEYRTGTDSGVCILAKNGGVVEKVDAKEILIRNDGGVLDRYQTVKFLRSNQATCINQHVIVKKDQRVEAGQVIADGPSTDHGELSLGKNMLIGFMTWEGYNYEDAVLLNENLVKQDKYTSIHIEEYEIDAKETKLGPEEITSDIPGVGKDLLANLDESGVIRIGAEVHSGDILVGRVSPKGDTEQTAEERLLRAIFGEKSREVRDTSLKVPHGESGIVVDVKVFTRENSNELSPSTNKIVRVYLAQRRRISVGDKMAGRHGNKGVISRILPQEDMPFLEDGRPLDIVLNPLGVPSRMNIGQVLEVHLGRAAAELGWKIMTPVFDGAKETEISKALEFAKITRDIYPCEEIENKAVFIEVDTEKGGKDLQRIDKEWIDENKEEFDRLVAEKKVKIIDGKVTLRDGRTGQRFDNPVTVGYMYFLKLHHLVDDKIHARSTGPYSLVTQQPLGGKAQFGGQRFGEMEVWALEAYGAAYTLQEMLTVKSDDIIGRVKTFEAIVKGKNVPKAGVPESFKVLVKELQSLGLDVKVLDKQKQEIDISTSLEDDPDDFRSIRDDKKEISEAMGDEDEYMTEIDDDGFFTEDLDASDFLDDEIASENSDDDTFGL